VAELLPSVGRLDHKFRRHWRSSYNSRQLKALLQLTPSAAARLRSSGGRLADFLEQVDYNGRRLAKLNVPPAAVLRALETYRRREELAGLHSAIVLALNNAYYRVREEEAQAFFDLFRAELEAQTLDDLLARFARILSRTFRARAARLYLDGRDARRRFIQAGEPAVRYIRDPAWLGRYASYWSIPFFAGGKPAGLIQLAFATRYEWLPRELELLDAVAERCLAAAEKARLAEEVKDLAAHMFQVEEEERRRISRDLHDEAGQSLVLARLQLEMLERTAPASWEGRAKLAETRQVVEGAIVEIRRILAALSPAVLEQLGLAAAVRQLTTRFRAICGARVRLRIALRRRMPRTIEMVSYRLLQECYHNIARHSGASRVKVSLRLTDCSLGLRVEDDGVGFDLDAATERRNSFGLAGMRERVALMGGSFEIRSAPGQGTAIAVTLPVSRPAPAASIRKGNYGQDSSFSHRRSHPVSAGHPNTPQRRA
jgi:signal transduction histidine kinase